MKKTKLLSIFMAGVLATTMVSTVVAAEPTTISTLESAAAGSSVVAQGTAQLPTISVTMPTTHDFKINPYKIGGAKSQIDGTIAKIINNSDVDINVQLKSATVTFDGPATVKPSLVTQSSIATSTLKGVYLELAYENVTKKNSEIEEVKEFVGEPKRLPITAKVTPTTLATLKAPTGELDKDTSVLLLKYDGETVANPASGWNADDKVTVTAVYNFTVAVTVTE